jgi:hypothetical protein
MKRFVSAKNNYLTALMWLIAIGFVALLFIKKPKAEAPSIYIFNTIIIGITATIIWILLDTKYTLTREPSLLIQGLLKVKLKLMRLEKLSTIRA